MTSSLDDISFKLGELSNGQATALGRMDKAEQKLNDALTQLGEIKTRMKPLAEKVAVMEPHVKHYAGVRKRAAWLNSLVVGLAGICGGSVSAWALRHFGG